MRAVILQPKERVHLEPILELLTDDRPDVALVASFNALATARRQGFKHIALAQHGIGQSYGGDPHGALSPGLPGGRDNEGVDFLVPNEHSAGRWRAAYPNARVAIVGSPRLDTLPARDAGPGPVIATSFHWNWYACAESMSAFTEWARPILELAKRYQVLGHSHPLRRDLPGWYASHNIEFEPSFDRICERADLYLCDNSSTLYEFASRDMPVIVLNSRRYRRNVEHGLRFWSAASVGLNLWPGDDLIGAVEIALSDPLAVQVAREAALDIVYSSRKGGARLAADALLNWYET